MNPWEAANNITIGNPDNGSIFPWTVNTGPSGVSFGESTNGRE